MGDSLFDRQHRRRDLSASLIISIMASSTPIYFQTPKIQQSFTSAHRPEDELDLAAAFIALDLDDFCDSDHEMDEPESPHPSEVNKMMEQILYESRLRRSQTAPARKRYIPDTPYDPSVSQLVQRLRECEADLDAVEYLIDEVWPDGKITLEGLMAPMGSIELRVFRLPAGSAKYLGLFRRQGDVGLCRLCPLDHSIPFKEPEAGLYHIARDHFEMGYRCLCECGEIYWTGTELKQHLKKKGFRARESTSKEMQSSPTVLG